MTLPNIPRWAAVLVGVVLLLAGGWWLRIAVAPPGVVTWAVLIPVTVGAFFWVLERAFSPGWEQVESWIASIGLLVVAVFLFSLIWLAFELSGAWLIGAIVVALVAAGFGVIGLSWLRSDYSTKRLSEALDGALATIGVGLLAALAFVSLWIARPSTDAADLDPASDSGVRLVAMGDSYMAGEGAQKYFEGTNREGLNQCRRTSTAYAYRVADELGMSLAFLACSGAETVDVLGDGQYNEPSQLEALGKLDLTPRSVVVISIGGNDAGFVSIGLACAVPGDCDVWGPRWVRGVRTTVQSAVEETLVAVRQAVEAKSNEIPIFVTTYPLVMTADGCDWTWLSRSEHDFVANLFTPELNAAIRTAAANAGVNVLELENVFKDAGALMCQNGGGRSDAATNFIGASPIEGLSIWQLPQVLHNSFHPSPMGHALFAAEAQSVIEAKLQRMSADGEAANTAPPPVDVDDRPLGSIALGEYERGFRPLDPAEAPTAVGCESLGTPTQVVGVRFRESDNAPPTRTVTVSGAAASDIACYTDAEGEWQTIQTSAEGELSIQVQSGSVQPTQAVYRREAGTPALVEIIDCGSPGANCPKPLDPTGSWLWLQLEPVGWRVALPYLILTLGGLFAINWGIPSQRSDHQGSAPASPAAPKDTE